MFKSIVVGTDGSETAFRAVSTAAELASALGATLHLVSVAKPVAATSWAAAEMVAAAPVAAQADWQEAVRTDLEETLERAARAARDAGVTVETHPRFGSPAEVLCDVAEDLHADLIVVGTRGMQGGKRFLGSIPNSVSHHAPCSVLIVDTVG
jgi:nucleotide-binding universal stress UspA family protein